MPTPQADEYGERLPRRLGALSAIAVLVGSTIGSGIFRSPAKIAADSADVPTFLGIWLAGGLIALCGALTLAELAALFPRTGGLYVYIREAFGEVWAFCFGWTELLVLRPAAYGAIAVTSAEYFWVLFGRDGGEPLLGPITWAQTTAGVFILIVGLVNYRGVTLGAVIQNVSTAFKVLAIVGLVGLGLLLTPGELPPPSEVPEPSAGGWAAIGAAMVSVLWAYDGWSDVGFVSGEVKDPKRNLPLAFIGGTAAIVVLYLALCILFLAVIPLEEMPGRPLIAADVGEALMGPAGAVSISALIMVSTFGTLNGSFMTGPRIFYAMAEDKLFFKAMGRVHPVHQTPSGSILMSIVLGIVFVCARDFGELADQFIIGIWPFYGLAVGAVFVLRKQRPELERPYKTFGFPVVPLVFLVGATYLLVAATVRQPMACAVSFAIMFSGVPVYLLWRRRRERGESA